MARPRKLSNAQAAQAATRIASGEPIEKVAPSYNVTPTTLRSSIDRLSKAPPLPLAKMPKAAANLAALAPASSMKEDDVDLAEVDEVADTDIPEGVDPAFVQRQIARVERLAAKAASAGNVPAFSTLTTRLVALMEHARKIAPAPKIDPNLNPDFIAARDVALARMQKIVAQALQEKTPDAPLV